MRETLAESILRNLVGLSKVESLSTVRDHLKKAQPVLYKYLLNAASENESVEDVFWLLTLAAWKAATQHCPQLIKIPDSILQVNEVRNIRSVELLRIYKDAEKRVFENYSLWPVLNFRIL
ncbi:hypothetical protein L0152_24280 [bacterium]|nr:hypothetical protein [bacterium]